MNLSKLVLRPASAVVVLALVTGLLSGCGGGGGSPAGLGVQTLESTLVSSSGQTVTPLHSGMPTSAPSVPGSVAPLDALAPAAGHNGTAVKVYTPAQIRSAYRLPALPANWASLSDTQAADMGAGQTIYIVTAFDAPNIERELQAFNTQFGLPGCTPLTISASATLPLDPASGNACQFAKVYASANNAMTATAPTYDASWAQEAALDVQWAHATAPLARIVLIEAVDDSSDNIKSAIQLANAMGPGVVSMSFGSNEGAWVSGADSAFSAANMSYVAAAGDSGTGVALWPAVSSKVLGVGGTTLSSYSASGRTETTWSSTGGGLSTVIPAPAYQSASVPGLGTQAYRSVADVAFNADPYTGQYVATLAPGATRVTWYSMGGTSLGTPQWAGLIAVARAHRARLGLSELSDVNTPIYQASGQSGFYDTGTPVFNDITTGSSNGVSAGTGYDVPTGLGTPNANQLITLLAPGGGTSGTSPALSSRTVTALPGVPLSFSVSYTAEHSVTWAIAGAPAGMTIDSGSGAVSWPNPTTGTYSVTVSATDSVNHRSGSATIVIDVNAAGGHVAERTGSVWGNSGVALSHRLAAISARRLTYAMDRVVLPDGGETAPEGLSVTLDGRIRWDNPVQGTTTLTITGTDVYGIAVVRWTLTLHITGPLKGPVISATPISGRAGVPLYQLVPISADPNDINVRRITVSVSGVPSGMQLTGTRHGVAIKWANPVAGTYVLGFIAIDDTPGHGGISTQANVTVTIE